MKKYLTSSFNDSVELGLLTVLLFEIQPLKVTTQTYIKISPWCSKNSYTNVSCNFILSTPVYIPRDLCQSRTLSSNQVSRINSFVLFGTKTETTLSNLVSLAKNCRLSSFNFSLLELTCWLACSRGRWQKNLLVSRLGKKKSELCVRTSFEAVLCNSRSVRTVGGGVYYNNLA